MESPGRGFEFTKESIREPYSDQFQPYNIPLINCNMSEKFDGTLFRLPIRFNESKIQSTKRSVPEVLNLIKKFSASAADMLLYLRYVREIKVYVWEEGREPSLMVDINANYTEENLKSKIAINDYSPGYSNSPKFFKHEVEITQNDYNNTTNSNNNKSQKWLVCNAKKNFGHSGMHEILLVNNFYIFFNFINFSSVESKGKISI